MAYHPFRHLGLKTVAIALAALLWLSLAGEHVAERIVRVPLERAIGREEAEQVQRVAVANALLEHCRLDWERLFKALTAHHRHRRGRDEADVNRITVWHGVWQGQALAMLRRDRLSQKGTIGRKP